LGNGTGSPAQKPATAADGPSSSFDSSTWLAPYSEAWEEKEKPKNSKQEYPRHIALKNERNTKST
jgi:hypothetical protein